MCKSHLSKLPVSFQSTALRTCSRGDISNTKIAPWKPGWPVPYSSMYHIKMYHSAIVTTHSLILISLFRFPADWQCQLQHFTPFFFSMCEITNTGTTKREAAGFSSCFSVWCRRRPLFGAGSRTGNYYKMILAMNNVRLRICLNSCDDSWPSDDGWCGGGDCDGAETLL